MIEYSRRPLLTIAVPTYNGAKTIRDMLDLMLTQVDERVEVLISDNCSTDETPEIIREYRKNYPFINYHRNNANIGADGNFLQCMRMARGKFTYLLSDDDVLIEDALQFILGYLETHEDVALVYLSTGNFRMKYTGVQNCSFPIVLAKQEIYTKDKKEFMRYALHYWGFVSSFLFSTARFKEIVNPERFFGTYWLQSYIHILCSAAQNASLGVIAHPCVGAGIYVLQSNLDTAEVDGIAYRKMLDYAVEHAGYERKQLYEWYVDRICLLGGHGIVKEKASGNKRIDKKKLFQCTWRYWQAWFRIYPYMLVPSFSCKIVMKMYRKARGEFGQVVLNRMGDQKTQEAP